MLENIKAEERPKVILSYVYRIIGRTTLVAAFLLAIAGELRWAVAALAVALWAMWSTQNVFTNILGNDIELIGRKVDLLTAAMEIEKPLDEH